MAVVSKVSCAQTHVVEGRKGVFPHTCESETDGMVRESSLIDGP